MNMIKKKSLNKFGNIFVDLEISKNSDKNLKLLTPTLFNSLPLEFKNWGVVFMVFSLSHIL